MRELKFRAWATSGSVGGFVYFDVREDNDVAFYEFYSSCEADNIEQYTGLKDKNDKEIYEGDIAKSKINKTYEVSIGEGYTRFKSNEGSCGGLTQGYIDEFEMEVIGNVHENPELMEDKK